MGQVVIENPVINSPFSEPTRHFRFDDEGITDEIVVLADAALTEQRQYAMTSTIQIRGGNR